MLQPELYTFICNGENWLIPVRYKEKQFFYFRQWIELVMKTVNSMLVFVQCESIALQEEHSLLTGLQIVL